MPFAVQQVEKVVNSLKESFVSRRQSRVNRAPYF